MKRTILLLTLVGAVLFAYTGAVLAQQTTPDEDSAEKEDSASAEAKSVEEEPVAGEVLVKFKDSVASQAKAQTHEEKGGEVKETIPNIEVDVVEVPEGEEEEKVAQYEADSNVEFAEVNGTYRAVAKEPEAEFTPNDPNYSQQWQYPKVEANQAWDQTRGNSSVNIAILDTGIDQSHEDLASKLGAQQDFTGSASGVEDNQGHGTHVAGSSAAISNNSKGVAGTCQDCTLMNGKVLNDSGNGAYSWIANGIIWAADNNAKVINMSLGGTGASSTLENAVNYASNKGVVVVAAAGNNNQSSPFYPAFYDKAIAVGSTDSGDTKSDFSNYGTWVDVAAPGSFIHSTAPDHNNAIWGSGVKYGTISGTSMATPHVAGLAGLVFSKQGLCSDNTCVRQKIESSIVDRSVLNNTGSIDWSKARINANKALGGSSDTIRPTIISSKPSPAKTNVPRTTNVVANFSEEIDKGTLSTSNVQLYKNGSGSPISATVTPSTDGKSVTLDPAVPKLAKKSRYQVVMWNDSIGIKDLAGNTLAPGGNYKDGGSYVYWSFKTRS
jgi:thermitase